MIKMAIYERNWKNELKNEKGKMCIYNGTIYKAD